MTEFQSDDAEPCRRGDGSDVDPARGLRRPRRGADRVGRLRSRARLQPQRRSRSWAVPHRELRRMPFDDADGTGEGASGAAVENLAPTARTPSPRRNRCAARGSRSSTRWSASLRPNGERVWIEIDVRPVPDGDRRRHASCRRSATSPSARPPRTACARSRRSSSRRATRSSACRPRRHHRVVEHRRRALYGYPADEVIGCHLAIIVPEDHRREPHQVPRSRRVPVAPRQPPDHAPASQGRPSSTWS